MADPAFKDIPESFEVEIGEAVTARTESLASFRELGPPDLCHVIKTTGKAGQREYGSFHFVSGVDASTSAPLAAYINSLTYAMDDTPGWFSKSTPWKITNGCYCCFNAFSRVDVRVDVKIPGGVQSYVVDLRGERHEATSEIWKETYMSAMLRAILYSDDPTFWLEAYRKLDPITTSEDEIRFLQNTEALFMKGWQVGSDPEIQVATVVSNHLTAGILKYFGVSGRWEPAANLFEKLSARDPEVASLLVKSYLGMNEEVKAVQIMSSYIKHVPRSYTLLHAQSDFLRSKGKTDWALKLAKEAVNCAPSEFVSWEKLTELYIDIKDYESALLTLNSCPMFTYNGRDVHRAIPTSRIHLPPKRQISDLLPEKQKTEDDEADPALLRLPAPGLRGTWARAYALLTRLVSEIGWDELLKTRSVVFVMEEEYRNQKAQAENQTAILKQQNTMPDVVKDTENTIIHEDGMASKWAESRTVDDDNASTRGVLSSRPSIKSDTDEGLCLPNNIPIIRVSTESETEKELSESPVEEETANGRDIHDTATIASVMIEKPVQVAVNEDTEDPSTSLSETFSFSNKRLCERWLDNLFMVLYEDLRVWTIFRAEVAHFKTQHLAYRKTGLEWEILGDLGMRLHHKEEAKEAYQRCTETSRYSQKSWAKLLEMHAGELDITRATQAAVTVAAYHHADYTEVTYPTLIARSLFKLGQVHGLSKITFMLMSMGLPEPLLKIMDSYLQYGKAFRVEGYDF